MCSTGGHTNRELIWSYLRWRRKYTHQDLYVQRISIKRKDEKDMWMACPWEHETDGINTSFSLFLDQHRGLIDTPMDCFLCTFLHSIYLYYLALSTSSSPLVAQSLVFNIKAVHHGQYCGYAPSFIIPTGILLKADGLTWVEPTHHGIYCWCVGGQWYGQERRIDFHIQKSALGVIAWCVKSVRQAGQMVYRVHKVKHLSAILTLISFFPQTNRPRSKLRCRSSIPLQWFLRVHITTLSSLDCICASTVAIAS